MKGDIGILEFDIKKKSDEKIKNAFKNFLKKPISYRKKYLQSHYKTAFDGYSFMGQKNSLNQYDTDMLHSFVISEFQNVDEFPFEFRDFFYTQWNEIKLYVREIELQMIRKLNIPILEKLYNEVIGHMVSCNYYPKPIECETIAKGNTRLSAHKDVSMFTVFPFGLKEGFSYKSKIMKNTILLEKNKPFIFIGYLLELLTGGEILALDHQVELPENREEERYSFAVFSIPKPKSSFSILDNKISAEDYYKKYLSLF